MDVLTDLDLFNGVRECTKCPLHQLRGEYGQAVPAEVGREAGRPLLAFMAEAPGRQENETGRPLVGPAGKQFGALLAGAGIRREQLLLMNTVRCRPPNNALASHPYASEACAEWTRKEIATYDPQVVVLMGKSAIEKIFGAQVKVGEVRGHARTTGADHEYGSRVWVPTYHPAALVRRHDPAMVELVVGDIRLAAEILKETQAER